MQVNDDLLVTIVELLRDSTQNSLKVSQQTGELIAIIQNQQEHLVQQGAKIEELTRAMRVLLKD